MPLLLELSANLHKVALINKGAHVFNSSVNVSRRHVGQNECTACAPAHSVLTLLQIYGAERVCVHTTGMSLSLWCSTLGDMATAKKVKLSDDAVAENDPRVFQALEQVQQKLDQVRQSGAFCAHCCYSPIRVKVWPRGVLRADHRSEE